MAIAHVFSYQYPRIREGLKYSTYVTAFVDGVPCPLGGYVYCMGTWHHMWFHNLPNQGKTFKINPPTLIQVAEHQVPKEIRLMHLLVSS